MKRLLIFVLILMLCSTAFAKKIHTRAEARLGGYSGDGGSAQDDSVKASQDLVHTDLDAIITYVTDVLGILGQSTGGVFYVDSSATGTTGLTWATAVNNLETAIGFCTANAGDIILIAPGHTDADLSGTAADEVDIDKHGITVIGLGEGTLMPTFDFTANATGAFAIGADNIRLVNLRFHANITDVNEAIEIESGSTDVTIERCVFDLEAEGTDDFLECIDSVGGTADRLKVIDCDFRMGAGACNAAINTKDADYMVVKGNTFHGDYEVAVVKNNTTASNHITIRDNFMYNGTITAGLNAQPCIELLATTSGFIVDNVIVCDVALPELSIVAADCYLFNNRYSETEDVAASTLIGLEVGKLYTLSKAALMTATTANLFDVDGGAIEIVSMFGQITTTLASMGNLSLTLDADGASADGTYDGDFSTAVDANTWAVGDVITFTAAISEGVTTCSANMQAGVPLSWYCSEGMIEQLQAQTATGGITWYMTFRPLVPGVTVTPQ